MADSHFQNLYGGPVKLLRTELADRIVQTAIRPVQLDLYGPEFLKWVVAKTGKNFPIIHIGDSSDFSCTGEFSRFVEIMNQAKKGWVTAPGNHDGFFFGNAHWDPTAREDWRSEDWRAACLNAGEPMTKNLFIRFYLAALILQERQRALQAGPQGSIQQELLQYLGLRDDQVDHATLDQIAQLISRAQGDWRDQNPSEKDRPFLRAVSWRIDAERPWRSFILQEVDMTFDPSGLPQPAARFDTSVRVILLDTAQYDVAPTLVPTGLTVNAGLSGELLSDQQAIARSWIEPRGNLDRLWVLMGHHPFNSLTARAQKAVDDLRRAARALLYVSAHTHAGQFIVHETKDRSAESWLELNVGSILDWWVEFRALEFSRTDQGWLLSTPRYTMDERLRELEGLPVNEATWEAQGGDQDYYLRHADLKSLSAEDTEVRLKNTLLAAYARLLRINPTEVGASQDPHVWPSGCQNDGCVLTKIDHIREASQLDAKIAFLLELARFEQERPVEDSKRRQQYRLSQALWASKYDSVHSRKPMVDDWYIILPKE